MRKYCYVYVLRSVSTKKRFPFELVYWEGCLDQAQRDKYLKSAWGKRYIKNRLRNYLTG
jgi:putative endonuclease